jgi:hypothetical protein
VYRFILRLYIMSAIDLREEVLAFLKSTGQFPSRVSCLDSIYANVVIDSLILLDRHRK